MVSKSFNLSRGIPGLQKDVLAFDVPKLSQALLEGLSKVRVRGRRPGHEHPDSGNFPRPLRLGRKRRGEHQKSEDGGEPRDGTSHNHFSTEHAVHCSMI